MKYFLTIIFLFSLAVPTLVRADEVVAEDAWAFLYEFSFHWQDGRVTQVAPYHLTTGDTPAIAVGPWSLAVFSESGQRLKEYSFDPAILSVNGDFTVIVPIEYRGASARVLDPRGSVVLAIDLRESRICHDDGICNADAGEERANCPTDCGAVAEDALQDPSMRAATIGVQMSYSQRLGGVLMRLSAAAAGVLLMVGMTQMLDKRRRS